MKFLGTFNWQKYDQMRQSAAHQSHSAEQASRNANQIGTGKAHFDAAAAHATASMTHRHASAAAKKMGTDDHVSHDKSAAHHAEMATAHGKQTHGRTDFQTHKKFSAVR